MTHLDARRVATLFALCTTCQALGACASTDDLARPRPSTPIQDVNTPLISRADLFSAPTRSDLALSPDGASVSFTARDPDTGQGGLWLAPCDDIAQARLLALTPGRVGPPQWAHDGRALLWVAVTPEGDAHIFAQNLQGDATRDLTPAPGTQARIAQLSPEHPGKLVAAIATPDTGRFDFYRIDIQTGSRALLWRNDEEFLSVLFDGRHKARLGLRQGPDGGLEHWRPERDGSWSPLLRVPARDVLTTRPVGFINQGKDLLLFDSRKRDTAALVQLNMLTGRSQVIATAQGADIDRVLIHPTERRLEGFASTLDRTQWTFFDEGARRHFAALRRTGRGEVEILTRRPGVGRWLVRVRPDDGPARLLLYDTQAREATPLLSQPAPLEGAPLTRMHPVSIPTRDGMTLSGYLSLPPWADRDGEAAEALPMVLLVHDGPWMRERWGYDPRHQWLANRGYAAMSVHFRGSAGFGKAFEDAGDGQWGAAMQDDLFDAIDWAERRGIARPGAVAMMGAGYGGTATLSALQAAPDKLACGVSLMGPPNLETWAEALEATWAPAFERFAQRVGDPRTDDGRALLKARSPLHHPEKLQRPLLMVVGAGDPRTHPDESDALMSNLSARQVPVTYVLYPDEGAQLQRGANVLAFYALAEGFLGECLGGRVEAVGDALTRSSAMIMNTQTLSGGDPTAPSTP